MTPQRRLCNKQHEINRLWPINRPIMCRDRPPINRIGYRRFLAIGSSLVKIFSLFFSIMNGLVLQNVQTDWRRRRRHFDFRLLLAKQAFSDFNGYKKHSSAPVSRRNDFDLPYVSMVIV